MFARLIPLSQETIGRIHPQAGRSIFWEIAPDTATLVHGISDPSFEKEAWLTTTLLDYGCCGYSLERSTHQRAVATILWCSPDAAAGCSQLPTAPVSADAEVLTSLFIDRALVGVGLESVLIDAAIMHLVDANASAIEAFGWREDFFTRADVDELLEGTVGDILRSASEIGLMSVGVLESAGFQVVADHPVLPRLRLDLPPQHDLLTLSAMEELFDQVLA